MATNKKEVVVSIKTDLNTASAQNTAKELQQIIGKSGISKEAKDAATKYLTEFEKAAKAMDAITSKGQIGTADYKSLNQYFKMMKDNYAKISEIAKETLDIEPASLSTLRESINKKVSAGEQEIRQRKVQFKGQAKAAVGKGISFEDAKDELTYLNSYIQSLETEKQKIYNDTVGVAAKQIDEIVAIDRKANGQKFKNLDDYKRYYETKQKEIGRLSKELEDPNLGEQERATKIAQLNTLTNAQLKRVESLKIITSLEEQEATAEERAAAATAKQTKEITDNTTKRDKLQAVLQETEKDISNITDSVNLQTEAERAQLKVEQDLYNTQKAQSQADIEGFDVGTQQNFGQVANDISFAGSELAKMKGIQEAVGKGFDNMTNRLKGFISGTYLLNQAFNKLKQASQIVTNLDDEITQIAVVTKQTTSEVWDSFQTFNQAAMELSTTTRQYLEGAKIFYQQGLNTVEVMSMVQATTMAAALSGVSFRDASETLTAAINGYNMAASKAGEITDKFAAVGAASAADFQELSTAMEKVASQAYSSGMSFDSLLGILAKGIETTREAPEAIGTGLKSIIARFQEMKENPMATLEDGINANRVEKALKSVGVALRDSNGEFRNMDEVFADLGEAWKTMSRNQRAYIATVAAGSR